MGLQFDASPEELKLFMEEAEEHLQLLEEDLVRLEKEIDNEELLQAIFRAAHTLKGSSATLGHQRMAQLTHGMENILDKVRKGQLEITTEIMDVLLEGLDILKILKEEIETLEESDISLEGILERLAKAAEGQQREDAQEAGQKNQQEAVQEVPSEVPSEVSPETAGAEDQVPAPGSAIAAPLAATPFKLDWDDKDQINDGVKQGKSAFVLEISLSEQSEMLSVRALLTLMALREIGEIIKSDPSEEDIEREEAKSLLRIVFISEADAEKIRKVLCELPDVIQVNIGALDITRDDLEGNVPPVAAQPLDNSENKAGKEGPNPEKAAPESAAKNAVKEIADNKKITKVSRTVRVDVEVLDSLMNLVGELVIDRTRLAQILTLLETKFESNDFVEDLNRTSVHIGRVTTLLQEEIMKARMLPVESLFNKFPRMMRDLTQKAGKDIDFVMEGQETELDRSIIEEIGDPLIHLLRNAVDHAVEPPDERASKGKDRKGLVKLSARHEENHIIISVKDDGRGIDSEKIRASAVKKGIIAEEVARRLTEQEAINLIFASGLSTAAKVSEVSGRGVGMDVVRNNLEKVNGTVEIQTVLGKGTEFIIKLPLTLAIIRALMVSVDSRVYAIPLGSVTETIRITSEQIKEINKREAIVVRGKVLPLLRLRELFNMDRSAAVTAKTFVVVVNLGGQQMGLVVDYLVGEQEVVIKTLGKFIGDVQGVAGATILGDGSVALIVDVPSLMKNFVKVG